MEAENKKYANIMSILSLVLSLMAFLMAVTCLIFFILTQNSTNISQAIRTAFVPILVFVTIFNAVTTFVAYIYKYSKQGRIAIILNIIGIIISIICYFLLLM